VAARVNRAYFVMPRKKLEMLADRGDNGAKEELERREKRRTRKKKKKLL
jgi:hypothetical protein